MKKIKYLIKITAFNDKKQEVKIETYASSATELLKNLEEILSKKSKTYIEKLLGL